MLQELSSNQFERARHLFQGFDYSLAVRAAIDGNNVGRIFVDDIEQPRTAFALTVEGYLLAGKHENGTINRALRRFLQEKIFSGEVFVVVDWAMSLAVHPEVWEALLSELIPTHEVEKIKRYHYLCRALGFDWRSHIPEGYSVRRIDRALLDAAADDRVREWMDIEAVWGTVDNYLEHGISFAVLYEGEMVAWCTPDCWAGGQMDVGIMTHQAHRRQGLASIAAAATVEECFKQGFSAVGWHCNAENIGSWKTAEKVGFERQRAYAYYYYMVDPIDHLAELGWYNYRQEAYGKTVHYYEQVFALREDNPDYYYHLAASAWALLQNGEKALFYLEAAADHGWTNWEYTSRQEEFGILHDTAEWDALLARIEND